MSKTKRKWIVLDWLIDGCLRAQDIPYSESQSIKEAIDGIIFGKYYQFAKDDSESTTTSTSYVNKLRLTTPALPVGKYRIGWFWEYRRSSIANDWKGRVRLDEATDLSEINVEVKDNSNYFSASGFDEVEFASEATHTFDIDYGGETNKTSYIRRARLEIWRVE